MPEAAEIVEAADEPICEWCGAVIAMETGCYRRGRRFCEVACWLDYEDYYED